MNENNYLIPANTKKGQLILNIFTPTDLIIFIIGIILTVMLIVIVSPNELMETIIVLSPGLLAAALVAPLPNYHNALTVIISLLQFLTQRQRFIWKGWNYEKVFSNEKK